MDKLFGQTLRELRKSKGMSQRELAKRVGVDFSYISKIENGHFPAPAADTIVKICNALGVPPGKLLALTGKVPSDIKDIISTSPAAMELIFSAQSMSLSEDEWEKLGKQLKRLRSES